MIDVRKVGQPTGLPGVYCFAPFDPEAAARGEYVISRFSKGIAGPGEEPKRIETEYPVRSVGTTRSRPGVFYFSTDLRFVDRPGFRCAWSDGAAAPPAEATLASFSTKRGE